MPVTVKPLPSSETFLLDLTASNMAVEWEQIDDRIRDLDQELEVRCPLNSQESSMCQFIVENQPTLRIST